MSSPTQQEIDAARSISHALNLMSLEPKEIGRILATEHRTLQQGFMGVVLGFIEEMANHFHTNQYDARNQAAVEFAVDIRNAVQLPFGFPFV